MTPGKAALLLVLAVVSLASVTSAQSLDQAGVYGMVTAQKLESLTYVTSGTSTGTAVTTRTDGSFSPLGGTGGVFYDFKSIGPVRLGADLRGSITHSNHGADPTNAGAGGRLYTAMGGLRASFPAHYKILAPYAEGAFGFARTDSGASAVNTQSGQLIIKHGFAYQGLVGLDVHALPVMDIRLFELGIGGVSGVESQPGSHVLESIGVGVVFHLPRL